MKKLLQKIICLYKGHKYHDLTLLGIYNYIVFCERCGKAITFENGRKVK